MAVYQLLIVLFVLANSGTLALKCYECSSIRGDCDQTNYGQSVECDDDSKYCQLIASSLTGIFKRKCGGDGLPGLKVQDYCANVLGNQICYCTTNNCNSVYNPNTKAFPVKLDLDLGIPSLGSITGGVAGSVSSLILVALCGLLTTLLNP